jgi:hypothetical protein
MHLRTWPPFLFLAMLPSSALLAQTDEELLRVALWYAKSIVGQATQSHAVLFVIPDSMPGSPRSDSLVRRWSPAFRQAGFDLISDLRQPGLDTLVATLALPQRDSSTTAGDFYTLHSYQASCARDGGGAGVSTSYVICDAQSCRLRYSTVAGVGLPCKPPS